MSLCLTSDQQLRSYGDLGYGLVSFERLKESGIKLRTSGYKTSGLSTTPLCLLSLLKVAYFYTINILIVFIRIV